MNKKKQVGEKLRAQKFLELFRLECAQKNQIDNELSLVEGKFREQLKGEMPENKIERFL